MTAMNKSNAEALASKWASNEVAPEDFDPRISEWKLEETVRELVKTGDLHQKQVVDEVNRRKSSGYFDTETKSFVDKHPIKKGR